MRERSSTRTRTVREPRTSVLAREVSQLAPGSFALVMATGIISSAARLLSFPRLAVVLLVLNLVFYVALCLLAVARLVRYFPRFREDLTAQSTGPGFFTTVAGTCVLGTELVIVRQGYGVGLGLLLAGLVLWAVLTYAFFAAVMTGSAKPAPGAGVHGGWMIAVVATESISVLATVVSAGYPKHAQGLLFLSLCFFLAGAMLYIALATIVVSRLLFLPLAPADLAPVTWVMMGAAAITTLGGARLLAAGGEWSFLAGLEPFLRGFTLLFWAIASWWIPLLLVLGVWRYVVKRFPLRYEPRYWSMVFPLGMYTACTFVLARSERLPFLEWVPRVSLWVALAAWLVVLLGMVLAIARTLGLRKA